MITQYPKDFSKVEGLNLWLTKRNKIGFEYSDGSESETYLEECLKQTSDLSSCSPELAKYIKDWPSRYHLSSQRSNLLRPLALRNSNSVLELGAGCGAITRYLGENVSKIVAVEGSNTRAKLAALRCRDLANVQVIHSNFRDIEFIEKFDVVTLIGVLEYSGLYLNKHNPYQQALEIAKSYLKDEGLLIIAIENKLGLKYFSGCSEDHTGLLFDGLEGYSSGSEFRTFGKQELEFLLQSVGLQHTEFLSPFPDYKLSEVIIKFPGDHKQYSEPYLYNWLGYRSSEDYCSHPLNLFQEFLVAKQVESNGFLQAMSNSFLVIASQSNNCIDKYLEANRISWKYNTMRAKKFMTQVGLYLNPNDYSKFVKRQPLYPQLAEQFKNKKTDIKHYPYEKTEFINGTTLMEQLLIAFRIKESRTRKTLQSCLDIWYNFLLEAAQKLLDSTKELPGVYLDCTPWNLIISPEGTLTYIDQEWHFQDKLPLKYVLFRGLFPTYHWNFSWIESSLEGNVPDKSFKSFFEYCLELINLQTDLEEISYLAKIDWELQEKLEVVGRSSWAEMQAMLTSIPPSVTVMRTVKQLKSQLQQKQVDLAQAQGRIEQMEGRIEQMESSKFWKLRTSWFRLKGLIGLPHDH